MADNQISVEEQLKAFQTSHRESLSFRYGLDPTLANAIPLGTVQEMEDHAKAFQQSLQTAAGGKLPAEVPSVGLSAGSQSSDGGNTGTPLATVNTLLEQKYKGPVNQAKGERP